MSMHMLRDASRLSAGTRIVVGLPHHAFDDADRSLAIATIVSTPEGTAHFPGLIHVDLGDGEIAKFRENRQVLPGDDLSTSKGEMRFDPSGRSRLSVRWTNALPEGSNEQTLRYVTGMLPLRRSGQDQPFLLFIESEIDDNLIARSITYGSVVEESDQHYEHRGRIVGNAFVVDAEIILARSSVPDARPGELLVAPELTCDVEGDRMISRTPGATVIGTFETLEKVGAFLPRVAAERDDPASFFPSRMSMAAPATGEDLDTQIFRGKARTQDDEALVFIHEVAPHTSISVLDTRGIAFADCFDAGDHLTGSAEISVPGPGLWLAHRARWWSDQHEGEFDSGIEASWRPATLEDLDRFELGIDMADASIADFMDVAPRIGLTMEQIDLARSSAEPNEAVASPGI